MTVVIRQLPSRDFGDAVFWVDLEDGRGEQLFLDVLKSREVFRGVVSVRDEGIPDPPIDASRVAKLVLPPRGVAWMVVPIRSLGIFQVNVIAWVPRGVVVLGRRIMDWNSRQIHEPLNDEDRAHGEAYMVRYVGKDAWEFIQMLGFSSHRRGVTYHNFTFVNTSNEEKTIYVAAAYVLRLDPRNVYKMFNFVNYEKDLNNSSITAGLTLPAAFSLTPIWMFATLRGDGNQGVRCYVKARTNDYGVETLGEFTNTEQTTKTHVLTLVPRVLAHRGNWSGIFLWFECSGTGHVHLIIHVANMRVDEPRTKPRYVEATYEESGPGKTDTFTVLNYVNNVKHIGKVTHILVETDENVEKTTLKIDGEPLLELGPQQTKEYNRGEIHHAKKIEIEQKSKQDKPGKTKIAITYTEEETLLI